MATGDFDQFYPDHPWAGITTNQRQWYDPLLRDQFRKLNVYGQFTKFVQSLEGVNAKTMTLTSAYDIHASTDQLGLRALWLPAAHVDSRSQNITFGRYGNKVAYDEFDALITYWKSQNGGPNALRAIINDKLGKNLAQVQDLLSRNALLTAPYKTYAGSATNFNTLGTTDLITTTLLDQVHLGMQFRKEIAA